VKKFTDAGENFLGHLRRPKYLKEEHYAGLLDMSKKGRSRQTAMERDGKHSAKEREGHLWFLEGMDEPRP
jgi:hypothetical protein